MKAFPSKILLFGEYTLLHGSAALAIPFWKFSGKLDFSALNNEKSRASNHSLRILAHLLENNFKKNDFFTNFDLASFKLDIENGLIFDSNIPYEFGLGSSGALSAALYDSYFRNPATSFTELREHLSLLESFFHGKSSGIDPMVSYCSKPIIKNGDELKTIDLDISKRDSEREFFLLDSRSNRNTKKLVDIYLKSCEDTSYINRIKQEFIPLVNFCIEKLAESKDDKFFENLKILSSMQFELFSPMIPQAQKPIWLEGLSSGHFAIKLCGAGGGGFFLGYGRKNELFGLDDELIFL